MALLPQDRQSQVMLLIIILMAALGWSFWNYWAQPTGQRIEATRVEIDSLQRVIDRAKQDLASGTVEDLRRKVEEYTALLAVMRQLVPEKAEVPALIDDISTKAKVRGVAIGRLEPLAVESGSPFDTYKYRLELIGHYDQLGEFLSDIASLRRIIVPQDLTLKPAQQQAQKLIGDTLGALLEAQFAIRTFVKSVAPAAGRKGAQPRGAARRDQQQDLSGQTGPNRWAAQGHYHSPAGNRVYRAGVRVRAAGESAARQAGGNAMKRIAALAAWLVVAAAPRALAGSGRDGEVRAVSVLPAAGSVEIVIDLQGAVELQDFTLASPARVVIDLEGARLVVPAVLYDGRNRGGVKNIRYAQFRPGVVRVVIDLDVLKDYQIERKSDQVRVKIGTERTAFEAWSSRAAAAVPAVASGFVPAASRGGAAARVAAPAPSGDEETIDAYLAAHAKESEQSQAPRITVTWDNADFREVVAGFAAFSGRTIIISKDVKGNVSAEIKNQPWDLAFAAVLEAQGLAYNV